MNQIKHFLSDILSRQRAPKGKKIAFIIALCLIFITPTLLATGYVIYNELASPDEYISVSLYNKDGDLLASEKSNLNDMGGSSLSEIFYNFVLEEKHPTDRPTISEDQTYIRAKIDHNGTEYDLLCYFSTDSETGGFYIDDQNSYYSIPKKLNTEFLCSSYAEIFYPSSKIFKLTTADLDVITPKSINWNYKAVDQHFLQSTQNKTTDKTETYEITSAIDISFEKSPDRTNAHVYSNDVLIYSGNADVLSSLSVESSDIIRVYIEAQWDDNGDSAYYGTIIYEFYVHLKNRSSFSISSDKVNAGGFIILNCYNVTDIQKIIFSSSRQGFAPVFKPYGSYWRSIIPFPEDTDETVLDMTVTYGATNESFSITVLPTTEKNIYSYQSFNSDRQYDPDKLRSAIFSTILNENPLVYFRGNFEYPSKDDYTLLYTHGSMILHGDALEDQTITVGNCYILNDKNTSGGSVRAVHGGIVAYVGQNDLLGTFVVLDHGCGLRTWYTGLSKADVSVGKILLTGEHLGKTAPTDLEGAEGFTLFSTIDDIMIDPETLWKNQ